jgi:hypothetical protein
LQEEAEFATKKLADVMVEMHRTQELKSKPAVSPIKKHDHKHSPSTHQHHQNPQHRNSPRTKKGAFATSVSFEEDDEYEEDEYSNEYSNDDFEEESSVLNSSRYSQSQSPSKQVSVAVYEPHIKCIPSTAKEGIYIYAM